MSFSREGRGGPAFPAQEYNIGGAHMILGDYITLYNRAANAGATKEITSTKKQAPHTQAQRLSRNRAARRAAVDISSVGHISNVYHLNRRIEGMYAETERRKNQQDPTVYPTYQHRTSPQQRSPSTPRSQHRHHHGASSLAVPHLPVGHGSHARTSIHQLLIEPWAQGQGYRVLDAPASRPVTAPSATSPSHAHQQQRTRRRSGDHYEGWSIPRSLHDLYPPSHDASQTYMLASEPRPSLHYDIYRKAIMGEVLAQRLYKERDLRHLFKTYISMAPLHDKQVVEKVVADLRDELDVA